MKLFLTTALLLTALALAAHAQTLSPAYPPAPPSYPPPPPTAYPPPPPLPSVAPPAAMPAPSVMPSPGPSQSFNPAPVPSASSAAPAAFGPEPQRQGNITFVSGGAGDEDRAALHGVANQYNLHLLFAARSGEYLANINVTVADARGQTVLDTIADGPIFYAKLPPGRYRVTASNGGQSITREMSVPASGAASQDFYWARA